MKTLLKSAWLAPAALIACLISGCQSMPPLNFNPPNVGAAPRRLDAELRSIIVTVARPDEKQGNLDFTGDYSKTIPDLWKTGLEDSLNRFMIFRDDGARKLNLTVKILKWSLPHFPASMATETVARYELIDRADGTLYFTTQVSARGEVPFSFSVTAAVRSVESANRSVQNNISTFLKQLETVDLSKPMFPRVKS